MSPGFPEALQRGVALFNAGRFYEAHEVWEDAWRLEGGARRELLQGLIQLSAGFHKLREGVPDGARKLFTRALARLEPLGDEALGVDLAALRDQVLMARQQPHAAPVPRIDALAATAGGDEAVPAADGGGGASCPYCGEPVEVAFDAVGPAEERYVEDCPVCCRPWTVTVQRGADGARVALSREDD